MKTGKLDDTLARVRDHMRRAVRELRLAGVQPPDAEVIMMQTAQGVTYEGNNPWNRWPDERVPSN